MLYIVNKKVKYMLNLTEKMQLMFIFFSMVSDLDILKFEEIHILAWFSLSVYWRDRMTSREKENAVWCQNS